MVLAQIWSKGYYRQNDSYVFKVSDLPFERWQKSEHHSVICEL